MSLRTQAEADLAVTLEASGDFGFPFQITDPAGLSSPVLGNAAVLHGQSGDIGVALDPDTGIAVSGRTAHLAVRISSLVTAGFTDIPHGIADVTADPWLVNFADLAGNVQQWKVKRSEPDRTLGIVTLIITFWKVL